MRVYRVRRGCDSVSVCVTAQRVECQWVSSSKTVRQSTYYQNKECIKNMKVLECGVECLRVCREYESVCVSDRERRVCDP